MRGMLRRTRVRIASLIVGGSAFVLSGCDPTVRETVLGGVEASSTTLFTTFIQAFFESLTAQDGEEEEPTTVKVFQADPSAIFG